MKAKNIKIPWWLKWAIKKALEWLVREILEELEEPSRSSAPVLLL